MSHPPVLILGVNGTIGAPIARALMDRGRSVRALVRDRAAAAAMWRRGWVIDWVAGDAMDRDAVIAAAAGCDTIVHALSPANYANWGQLVLPMLSNTLAAARASGGARIVLPGTIYNYDPAATPVLDENSPQRPRTEKGRIRVELERRLEAASGDCPILIVRAGDYLGDARSSWFTSSLVRPGSAVRRVLHPGQGVGHTWAYLPDLAEAVAQLLDMPQALRSFERLQFAGIWDADGSQVTDAIRKAVGRCVPERGFPWWLMRTLAPFGGFPRDIAEIEAYWRHPVRLDNSRLIALLGREPHTPLDIAVRRTLQALGCLEPVDRVRQPEPAY